MTIKMLNKARICLSIYQLAYGVMGVLYDIYFLINASNAQQILFTGFLLIYSLLVFIAGYRALNNQSSWMHSTLFVQMLQVYPIVTQYLYISLKCGISYGFVYNTSDLDINLLDLNSVLAWREAPILRAGINIPPLILCAFLIAVIMQRVISRFVNSNTKKQISI